MDDDLARGLTYWGWGIAYAIPLGFPQFVWGKSLGMGCDTFNFQGAVPSRTTNRRDLKLW